MPAPSRSPSLLLWPLITCLYISQGIPFGLAMEALPATLRHAGAELSALAWLPLVGLPWVLKWSWAPWVDNHWQPGMGRRRSWIIPMQSLVLACLLAVWALGISGATLPGLIALAVLASVASATQDVATDALVAEQFSPASLPSANAIQVASTMIGFFYGGPVFLMLYDKLGQGPAMLALALPVATSLLLIGIWREPLASRPMPSTTASLSAFLKSGRTAWALLAAAFLSAITLVACHGLGKLVLVDAGWPLSKVGQIGLAGGIVTISVGCGGGAWLVRRLGAWNAFHIGIGSAGLAALLWVWLAWQGSSLPEAAVWTATLLASVGAGSASVAVMTAAMHFAHARQQAGTDMTLVQSMRDLGEMAASSSLIALAAGVGYAGGFLAGLGLAVLTLILVPALLGRTRRSALRT